VPQSQENTTTPAFPRLPCHSTDYDVVVELVPPRAKVLDLGCGSGELLERLVREKQVCGRGLDIDPELVISCVEKGLSVVQGNLDEGLAQYSDKSFDWVVLNQTLQVTHRPAVVLREMLRVGHTGIVSFPNFAYWRARSQLLFRGRMPISRTLPFPWYSTPNIHLPTIRDFRRLCRQVGGRIIKEIYRSAGQRRRTGIMSNLLSEEAIFVLASVDISRSNG